MIHEALVLCWCVFRDPMNGSLPGPSVHGILQARIQEWVAILFSRGLIFPTRHRTQVFCIAGRLFTIWATREAPVHNRNSKQLMVNLQCPSASAVSLLYSAVRYHSVKQTPNRLPCSPMFTIILKEIKI